MSNVYDPYGLLFVPTPQPARVKPVRRRVFVSYQHSTDQRFYDEFSQKVHGEFEVIFDNSLRRRIDSTNPEYVIQRIRDEYITGSSCTVLLCGLTSFQRKYLDWEIKATLDRKHGLIGIKLPTLDPFPTPVVPERFAANVHSGYAIWEHWSHISAHTFHLWVEAACARNPERIINPREIMPQNGQMSRRPGSI